MAVNGKDIVISVEDTPGGDMWTVIPVQRALEFTTDVSEIDASSKADTAGDDKIAGNIENGVTMTSLFSLSTESTYVELVRAVRARDTIRIRRVEFGTEEEQASVFITQFRETASNNEVIEINWAFVVKGSWAAPSS